MTDKLIAKGLKINGIVQGVGFRPFVFQLAKKYNIKGNAANTSEGVLIHAQGLPEDISAFCRDIEIKKPPLAHITEFLSCPEPVVEYSRFSIIKSKAGKAASTLISPDVSICRDCLREMMDPLDPRFGYPFINCTNCGPRYTIIDNIPYDRPNTSMKIFPMCKNCQAEYDNPENRRFHAQPNACPVCGPQVKLCDKHGNEIKTTDPVLKTAQLLKSGNIVALKGLGGFHLAADAQNQDAVSCLRQRKAREEKPLALMSYNLDIIKKYAQIDLEDEILLNSIQCPIVILKKRYDNKTNHLIAQAVSPKNNYFGVMLPYTPLHYLLLSCIPFTALVMTSANISNIPIAIDNNQAFKNLAGIADYFLIHNRDIYLRSDDSIVRNMAGSPRFLRRSRGYVPTPIFLKHKLPQILACGAGMKNTICLTREKNAFISQHIGNMDNLETFDFFKLTIEHLKRILDIKPEIIAHDLHPDYMSTEYALAYQGDVQKIGIQHHHAHIVSCMAENHIQDPVIGLSFDGTGLGTDGHIWGGEILISEYHSFTRAAHFSYLPMPGSSAAIKEPWRMAVSCLYHAFGKKLWDIDLLFLKNIEKNKLKILLDMIDKDINSPQTSSLGRFFDSIAALTGIRTHASFEGQAAMELEMEAENNISHLTMPYDYTWTSEQPRQIMLKPIIQGIVRDIQAGCPVSAISSRFHMTLICLVSDLCGIIGKETGIKQIALSGGVFQNAILFKGLISELNRKGFKVFTHSLVPCSDGGISLGQAVAAWAVLKN
ncbi:Carbamoyltransferase [Desulfonema limicola]|uniref:Carbamoyltransferase n=1 Tax=Desulfonema limicola TaxID=45656 RepID=A0A975B4E7_9BACT|nr:carbamoyltransferase HypF [Desulfonema limicola]QTA78589.1 Carbamoyltransferase [Desulfonema limicola]